MWQAYEIAMEIARLAFCAESEGVIDFDRAFYCAWMDYSDVFDAPWWCKGCRRTRRIGCCGPCPESGS